MSSSASIEIEQIRADAGHAAANLNAIVARLHSRTRRSLRDSMSLLFSAPEITALQQHASQLAQFLGSGSARATSWYRSLNAQLAAITTQCQQAAMDEETLSAEVGRADEYMRAATRRMGEQARRLAGTNDAAHFAIQPANAAPNAAQTCLSAVAHVLRIVDTKMQNTATGVGGSKHYADPRRSHERDAELRSLSGIKAELTDLYSHVAAECTRIAGLASHVAALRRQRTALEAHNAQLVAMMRHATETKRAFDAAASGAGRMVSMASLTSVVRAARAVAADLQGLPHVAQATVAVETRLIGELEVAAQGVARSG